MIQENFWEFKLSLLSYNWNIRASEASYELFNFVHLAKSKQILQFDEKIELI